MKKAKVKIKNCSNTLSDKTLHTIGILILYNKIKISDLPISIRLSSKNLYIYSFRASRGTSCKKYIENLMLLFNDLKTLEYNNNHIFVNLLETYLKFNPFNGEEEFENFKKDILQRLPLEL